MELAVYRSLWGYPISTEQALHEIAEASYAGVELEVPMPGGQHRLLAEVAGRLGLGLILQIALRDNAPATQLDEYRRTLAELADLKPVCVVALSGRDCWSVAEATRFYEAALDIENEVGFAVAHETHRQHALMTPWRTRRILDAVPDLRICMDISHWVVACERLLSDQADAVTQASQHVIHIHGRVGSEQAPQVADPRDRRFAPQLKAFEDWWDQVWEAQRDRGLEVSTFTPEYGPPPYQVGEEDGAILAAKRSDICEWQARRTRSRFADRYG